MFTRRNLLLGGLAITALPLAAPAAAHHSAKFKKNLQGQPDIQAAKRALFATLRAGHPAWFDPRNHFLYLIERPGRARRYGVGVGRAGLAFRGGATIERKAEWPSWTPTKNMIRREPHKYARYAKGVPGGINNPLGAPRSISTEAAATPITASTARPSRPRSADPYRMGASA